MRLQKFAVKQTSRIGRRIPSTGNYHIGLLLSVTHFKRLNDKRRASGSLQRGTGVLTSRLSSLIAFSLTDALRLLCVHADTRRFQMQIDGQKLYPDRRTTINRAALLQRRSSDLKTAGGIYSVLQRISTGCGVK